MPTDVLSYLIAKLRGIIPSGQNRLHLICNDSKAILRQVT